MRDGDGEIQVCYISKLQSQPEVAEALALRKLMMMCDELGL